MANDERVDIYLPLYVRDFLTSTIGWTAEERGHYMTLLMLQWDRLGLPPDLAGLERLSPGVGAVWSLLEAKFPVDADGQRRNQRLEEHRARAIDLRQRRSAAGRAAAAARSCSTNRPANVEQSLSNRSTNVEQSSINRSSIDNHPPSPSPSPSYPEISPTGEIKKPAAQDATSDPPQRRKRSQPAASISWTAEAGWTGITDADRSEWRQAFPGAVLDQELAKSTAWLKANPTKAGKRNWRKFLVGWLGRCQDRGGTNRDARATGPPPSDPAKRRWWRGEAGTSMTDAEYAVWKRDRGTGGVLSSVAESLKVKE